MGVKPDGTQQFLKLNCKCWDCGRCGPRRAKQYRHAIIARAKERGLSRFVTLTLDPKKLHGRKPVRYLADCWSAMRKRLQRKYGVRVSYIRVLEFQKNGMPHLHLVVNRYVPVEWLRIAWQEVGGGWQVWIKFADIHRVGPYLAKYLSEDLLMSAPKGTRRVTCSQDICMFPKDESEVVWGLLRCPLDRVRQLFAAVSVELFDESGDLVAFEVSNAHVA